MKNRYTRPTAEPDAKPQENQESQHKISKTAAGDRERVDPSLPRRSTTMDWMNCWICLRSSEDESRKFTPQRPLLAIFHAARKVQGHSAAREQHPYCDRCFGSEEARAVPRPARLR